MFKRDYLQRLIEEIAAVAARALGLAREQKHDEAQREIAGAYRDVGLPAMVLDRLDATSIRMMSGDKTAALVELLDADAAVAELRGDAAHAGRRRALAEAIRKAGG